MTTNTQHLSPVRRPVLATLVLIASVLCVAIGARLVSGSADIGIVAGVAAFAVLKIDEIRIRRARSRAAAAVQ